MCMKQRRKSRGKPFSLVVLFVVCLGLPVLTRATEPLATFSEDVETVAVSPVDARCLFAVGAGRFHASLDGGATWRSFDAPRLLSGERLLVPDAASRLTVYLLSGNQVSRFSPGRVYRTTDAGENWTQIAASIPDIQIASFVQDPSDPGRFYCADASGMLYLSAAGATAWRTLASSRFRGLQIGTIAVFNGSRRMYLVGVSWEAHCPCGDVYRSPDGGATWEKVVPVYEGDSEVPTIPGVVALRYSPGHPDVLWGVEAYLAIYSSDGGSAWTEMQEGLEQRVNARQNVVVDPADPGAVYVFGGGIWRGVERGENWQAMLDAGTPVASMVIWNVDGRRRLLYASGASLHAADAP